jgi:chitinase
MLINKKKAFTAALLGSVLLPTTSHALDCKSLTTWQANIAYTGGQQVQYQQNAYKANWWTQNQNPEEHFGPWQEWALLGTCSGSNQAPTVSVLSPLNNAVLTTNDSVVISANAEDNDGNVSQVEFFYQRTKHCC